MTTASKSSCHIPPIHLTLPSPSELLKKGRWPHWSVRLQVYGVFWWIFNSQSSCPVGWLGQGEDDLVIIWWKLERKHSLCQG